MGWNGVLCAGVILSVMGAAVFLNVLGATNPWPAGPIATGTEWLVPKSPVAYHTLGLLPISILP